MDLMRRMRRSRPSQQDAPSPMRPASDSSDQSPILTGESAIVAPSVESLLAEPLSDSGTAATLAASGTSERRVVGSAAIITAGSLLSSILGMVRLEVINALFYGGAGGAFTWALRPIQQVSDLLIGGSVSGALIPTFVDYSADERRAELRHVYCTVANLVALTMIVAMVGIIVAAPYFVPFEAAGFTPADQQLTVRLVQIAALSLLGLGLYAVGSALLYALKEVVYPAFATGIYHVGVILCGTLVLFFALHQSGVPFSAALLANTNNPVVELARQAGARGLAAGAALGAAGEVLLLLPGLRKVVRYWQPVLDLRHPAVRQILRLYAPLLAGLVISVAAQQLDISLISRTPGGSTENTISFTSAVTLIQFPVGLVSAALSFSALPVLARASADLDTAAFKRTLVLGIRLGLLLMVPAMVGLLVLGTPIMSLLFQHGTCGSGCTDRNVLALHNMAYQLPFLAIDQMLIAAFYARKNTIIPTLVGLASIACYAAVALTTFSTIGLPGIAFANAVQNSSHAIILFVVLTLAIGDVGMRDLGSGAVRIGGAALGMAAAGAATLSLLGRLNPRVFNLHTTSGAFLLVVLAGLVASVTYFVLARLLRIPELSMLSEIVRRRLGRARG